MRLRRELYRKARVCCDLNRTVSSGGGVRILQLKIGDFPYPSPRCCWLNFQFRFQVLSPNHPFPYPEVSALHLLASLFLSSGERGDGGGKTDSRARKGHKPEERPAATQLNKSGALQPSVHNLSMCPGGWGVAKRDFVLTGRGKANNGFLQIQSKTHPSSHTREIKNKSRKPTHGAKDRRQQFYGEREATIHVFAPSARNLQAAKLTMSERSTM